RAADGIRVRNVVGVQTCARAILTGDAELFQVFDTCDVDAELETIIRRSLLIKKCVVERDETEQGLRAILNFGHTLGHGIEAVKEIGRASCRERAKRGRGGATLWM